VGQRPTKRIGCISSSQKQNLRFSRKTTRGFCMNQAVGSLENSRLSHAWLYCVVAYVFALAAAWATIYALPSWTPLWRAAAADAVATLVIFLAGVLVRNSSLYDPYWSVAPFPLVLYGYLAAAPLGVESWRVILVLSLLAFWGVRLTGNWLIGWSGLAHQDWRYDQLREQTGRAWWFVNLAGIHFFPTVLVFLGCLPAWVAVTTPHRPLGWLDILATLVALTAVAMEWIADAQLHRFRKTRQPGELMRRGLWAYSRHPNYFGEILFWVGMYLFGLAAAPALWWIALGPASMLLLFLFVSIPLIEKKMLRSRPAYRELQQEISVLLPLPPRRRG
jgi:steroid 5-alpha reductase family enzyme